MLFLSVSLSRSIAKEKAATVWTVCSVNCDFTLIQAAINDSQVVAGDTLRIEESGVHTESGILVHKGLTIEGVGTSFTVIQAAESIQNSTNRVFNIVDGINVTIQDLTVQHGQTFQTTTPDPNGGGIRSGTGGLTLIDVHIRENESTQGGGGIYNESGPLIIYSSSIHSNKARFVGGGIYSRGSLTITNETNNSESIYNNESVSSTGGGIYHSGETLSISQIDIIGNKANKYGGGISLFSAIKGAKLHDVYITENQSGFNNNSNEATCYGAGIYNRSLLIINNSYITKNKHDKCSAGYGYGGGIMHDSSATLTIHESHIFNNTAKEGGAGIFTHGPLGIKGSTVSNNSLEMAEYPQGSGIEVRGTTLTATQVTLYGNKNGSAIYIGSQVANAVLDEVEIMGTQNDSTYGGGIHIQSTTVGSLIKIKNSSIYKNSSERGGGIHSHNYLANAKLVNLSIINSSIFSNTAKIDDENFSTSGQGGGVWVVGTALTMTNSIVSGNFAENHGGGFVINGDPFPFASVLSSSAQIVNTTISGNKTLKNGGGVFVDSYPGASISIIHSTISNNTADLNGASGANGGGIYREAANFPVHLHNSIIAGNYDPRPNPFDKAAPDCSGIFQTINHDLLRGDTVLIGTLGSAGFALPPAPPPPCTIVGDGVQTNISSGLDLSPLQYNGGDTQTHALGTNSIAIRTAQIDCTLYDISVDQRGYSRTNQCDIGAFEFGGIMPQPTETPTPEASMTPNATLTPVHTSTPIPTVTATATATPQGLIFLPLINK